MCLEEGGFSEVIKVKGEIRAAIERTASSEKVSVSGRMAAMMTEKQFQQFMHLIWTTIQNQFLQQTQYGRSILERLPTAVVRCSSSGKTSVF